MPMEVLPVPALPCAWAPLVESSVATTTTALMMLLSHICQFLRVTRLPTPRNDQAKQESDCEVLDRRLARQARQLLKDTTGRDRLFLKPALDRGRRDQADTPPCSSCREPCSVIHLAPPRCPSHAR